MADHVPAEIAGRTDLGLTAAVNKIIDSIGLVLVSVRTTKRGVAAAMRRAHEASTK